MGIGFAPFQKPKIDPVFHTVINFYIVFLSQFERNSHKGDLHFPCDFLSHIIQKSGWQGPYDSDLAFGQDIFDYVVKTRAVKRKDLTPFFKAISLLDSEDLQALLKICNTLIKALPEKESREYYISNLNPYRKFSDLSRITSSEKANLDFYSLILSLITRYLFVILFRNEKPVKDQQIAYFQKTNAILSFINVVLSMFSQITNSQTLAELKERISKGDDKALFKAATIDKSILYLDDVKARVLTAQLTGDSKFFAKLGKAITDDPLKRIGQHGKTYAVLKMFWFHGLYKLTNEELYDFLKSCGLIPPAYPYAFEKFIQRHIKNKANEIMI